MTFINVNAPEKKDSSITTPVAASADTTGTNENIPNICNKMKRGAFLVLEGVDRCGKTTQCSLLLKHLVQTLSLSAVACRFPDRTTPIGQMINAYLLNQSEMDDRAIHLLFSANRWEASKHLCQQLASGTTVVCDRYAYSGVAFSAAKEGAGLSLDWCKSADIGLPAPDAVIFLDISQEEAEKRGGCVKYSSARVPLRSFTFCSVFSFFSKIHMFCLVSFLMLYCAGLVENDTKNEICKYEFVNDLLICKRSRMIQ